jgi:hypothetical protein
LQRRLRSERVERFRSRRADLEATPIREWWEAISADLQLPGSAEVPDALSDRAQDSWEPLLALADAAGGAWPELPRKAAVQLSDSDVDHEQVPILLLSDIRKVFAAEPSQRVTTKNLMERLLSDAFEDHPWQEWSNGRGLKPTSRLGWAYDGQARRKRPERPGQHLR